MGAHGDGLKVIKHFYVTHNSQFILNVLSFLLTITFIRFKGIFLDILMKLMSYDLRSHWHENNNSDPQPCTKILLKGFISFSSLNLFK